MELSKCRCCGSRNITAQQNPLEINVTFRCEDCGNTVYVKCPKAIQDACLKLMKVAYDLRHEYMISCWNAQQEQSE